MRLVKVLTHPANTSFNRLSKKWVFWLNKDPDIIATLNDVRTDVTILHPAIDVILNYHKIDRNKDGKIICVDVSDTDKVSEKYAKIVNENCDVIVTHSDWSRDGMVNGGVKKPIYVFSHGIEYKKVKHGDKIGFYLSLLNEQMHRKGTDLELEVMNRLPSNLILVKQYLTNTKLKWESVGWVDDIFDGFYSKISIFVHLPRGGAQEIEVYEALASGCKVVVTDHPLFKDLPVIRVKSHYIPKIVLPSALAEFHVGGGYEADINDTLVKIVQAQYTPPPDYHPKTMKQFIDELKSIF